MIRSKGCFLVCLIPLLGYIFSDSQVSVVKHKVVSDALVCGCYFGVSCLEYRSKLFSGSSLSCLSDFERSVV